MSEIMNGNDLLLYVNVGTDSALEFVAVAHASSHKYSLKAETKERVTKDTGKWRKKTVSGLSASVTTENLVSYNAEYGYKELLAKSKTGTPVMLAFGQNIEAGSYEKGLFVITSIDQDSKAGEDVTMSVSFENSGEVTTETGEIITI